MKGNEFNTQIDGMSWPSNSAEISNIEYKLRHSSVTNGEKMVAAQIISCYVALIKKNTKERNKIASLLKHVIGP